MPKRKKDDGHREPGAGNFVQVVRRPSIGVETGTGRAWVGIDQQVGHGSADALFALTAEQYAAVLAGEGLGGFEGECWRGGHDDLLLFHPGGRSSRPERWHPARPRMLQPRFEGELWWHVDALGEPDGSDRAAVARSLAPGADGAVFHLVGEGAHPRPAALIGGLGPGSDRARARAVLGEPVVAGGDAYAVEGDLVRLGYVDGGLATIALERPAPRPLPEGPVRALLAALDAPEGGEAFRAVARLAGGAHRRWASSSGFSRRLLAFDGGGEVQVADGLVLSVRLPASGLLPAARADVHRVLGAPSTTYVGTDLYRYGDRDLLVSYGSEFDSAHPGAAPVSVTAVPRGVSVSHHVNRWRSGEFTLFLDVLGLPEPHPLVEHVRTLPGVRLALRGGLVSEVVIGDRGHRAERLAAFADGLPAEPARADFRFGRPEHRGRRDDSWQFERGWIHVHYALLGQVATVTVTQEPPRLR
ncbi:hypothetical protein [Kitasatospora phosalacinea]|uniref:Uncharacterized protein n=1 Tax=Kitasatospora phosalacinea TaxID=2065 RepID=A0A9W6PPT4_9ACTN|nr:hypothetical protein [Kitasatospora phosalacinea]GLW59012.1 hypothetical protein Kpho01_70220 [Kitasatospora phosalacinea]